MHYLLILSINICINKVALKNIALLLCKDLKLKADGTIYQI